MTFDTLWYPLDLQKSPFFDISLIPYREIPPTICPAVDFKSTTHSNILHHRSLPFCELDLPGHICGLRKTLRRPCKTPLSSSIRPLYINIHIVCGSILDYTHAKEIRAFFCYNGIVKSWGNIASIWPLTRGSLCIESPVVGQNLSKLMTMITCHVFFDNWKFIQILSAMVIYWILFPQT